MSAAAAILVMMLVSAVFAVTVLTVMMVSATTATTAREDLDEMVDLLLCGVAILTDLTCESQCLTGQRVVGVNRHTVFLHLRHLGVEVVAFGVVQGDDGAFVDVIVVEMTVDCENLAFQLVHALWHVFAEGLCRLEDEVEGRTLLQGRHLLLETVESETESRYKLEGAFLTGLLLQRLLAVGYRIELIDDRHKLVWCFFHTLFIYIYAFGCKGTNKNRDIVDLHQKYDCLRTQFHVNACVNQKIAVPLHRQKTFRITKLSLK